MGDVAKIAAALAAYDAAAAECPLSKRRIPGHVPCPRCKATGNEGCGVEGLASARFIAAVRAHLLAPPTDEQVQHD